MFRLFLVYFLFIPFLSNAVDFKSFYVFNESLNYTENRFIALPEDNIEPYLHKIENKNIDGPTNFIYRYKLPEHFDEYYKKNGELSLVLFEDGILLRKLNSNHYNIEHIGMGRTSFFSNGYLYFSTSDKSPATEHEYVISISLPIKIVEEDKNQYFDVHEIVLNNEILENEIQKNYFFPKIKKDMIQIDMSEIEKYENLCYRYKLPQPINHIIQTNGSSSAILIENETILTKTNCWHGNIINTGMGRTSFFEDGYVYFSTSDNSLLEDKKYYIVLDRPFLEINKFEIDFPFDLNKNYNFSHNYKVLNNNDNYDLNNNKLFFHNRTKNGLYFLIEKDKKFNIKNIEDNQYLFTEINIDEHLSKLGFLIKNYTGILENDIDLLKTTSVFNKKNISNIYNKTQGDIQFYSTSPKIHSYNSTINEYLSIELPRWSISMMPEAIIQKTEQSGAEDIKMFFNITAVDDQTLEIRQPYLLDLDAPNFDINPEYSKEFDVSSGAFKFSGESIKIGQAIKNSNGLYDGKVSAHGDGTDIVVSPPNFNLDEEKAPPRTTQSLISLIIYDEQSDNGFVYKPRKVAAITYHWLLHDNFNDDFIDIIQDIYSFRDLLNGLERSFVFKNSIYFNELKKLIFLN